MEILEYVKPSLTGITFVSGPGPLQSAYDGVLSYLSDVVPYAAAIGAKLMNPLNTPALNIKVNGVTANDAAQPWVVQFPGGQWQWAGIAINQQVKDNGGGTEYTDGSRIEGDWKEQPSGVWEWSPKPVAVAATPALVTNNPGDAAAFAIALGVNPLTPAQFDAETLYYLRALGALANVPAFTHSS